MAICYHLFLIPAYNQRNGKFRSCLDNISDPGALPVCRKHALEKTRRVFSQLSQPRPDDVILFVKVPLRHDEKKCSGPRNLPPGVLHVRRKHAIEFWVKHFGQLSNSRPDDMISLSRFPLATREKKPRARRNFHWVFFLFCKTKGSMALLLLLLFWFAHRTRK
jgi:hypothetical protein